MSRPFRAAGDPPPTKPPKFPAHAPGKQSTTGETEAGDLMRRIKQGRSSDGAALSLWPRPHGRRLLSLARLFVDLTLSKRPPAQLNVGATWLPVLASASAARRSSHAAAPRRAEGGWPT